MFRENVLNNQKVIARVAGTMIPVALDARGVRNPGTREYGFLKPLMKQPDMQGILIVSPEGKALGRFDGFDNMVGRMNSLIDDALKAYGGVKPRKTQVAETHPNRGTGVMSDGSVCLAAYVRRYGNTLHQTIASPVISSVTLSEKEFKALAPREAVPGAEWSLPEGVARRFCRLTSPLCAQHAPQPDWVTGVRIRGKVQTIQAGVARLSYEGHLSSAQRGVSDQEVKLTGEGVYDVTAKKMRSILIVGSGRLVWKDAPGNPAPFHALAEWSLEK